MRAGMKMYMLANRGGSGGRNEMEMGYGGSEMRRGGSGGRNEASMGYGSEMGYGRSEGGSGGRNEMRGEMGDMENRFRGGEGYGDNPGMTYGMNAEHHRMNEMENRSGQMQMGRGKSEMKMTREMAEEWMMGILNEDESKGPHWSMDQAKRVMQQRGIQADPAIFWAVMNMMYSDYYKVFVKHGVGDRVDIYADMTSAWMNDKDIPDYSKKTAAYYQYVVNQ